jgi:hypothetical protein
LTFAEKIMPRRIANMKCDASLRRIYRGAACNDG